MTTRREALVAVAGAAGLVQAQIPEVPPHAGNLYPALQAIADASPLDLSFLRPEFTDLAKWQGVARRRLFDLLAYSPPPVAAQPEILSRVDRGDHFEERLRFRTTPVFTVPAHLLLPKKKGPAPGVVVLHSHDGIYLWGRDKVVAVEDEHPYLTKFKQERYGGKNVAVELVRRGYAAIAIDMFYWGERRLLKPDDPVEFVERPKSMDVKMIEAYSRRSSENESLTARSLMTAGASWPGVMLWDDIRTLDYLASRPEVDKTRLGCVGLSVGGYRSFLLAALDARIRAAVAVGWMTSYAAQIRRHTIHTMGLSFLIPGMYRHFDLPDLAAAIAPRAVFVQNGSRDPLFDLGGVKSAFSKIEQCYRKAGAPAKQRTHLYDVPHQFNAEMQAHAWEFFAQHL